MLYPICRKWIAQPNMTENAKPDHSKLFYILNTSFWDCFAKIDLLIFFSLSNIF